MPGIEQRVAAWDPVGQAWSPLGTTMNAAVLCLLARPDGSLFAGGAFTSASGTVVNGIARWTGTTWQPLAGGVWMQSSGAPGLVLAMASLPNGDLVAGGQFDQAGGTGVANVARWNGTSWSAMGAGSAMPVSALAVDATGAVLANGQYSGGSYVATWNGSSWSALGGGFASSPVLDLVIAAGGQPVITTQSAVFRLGPAGWVDLLWPTGSNLAQRLAPLPNGDLLLLSWTGFVANFTFAVQRWNGSAWVAARHHEQHRVRQCHGARTFGPGARRRQLRWHPAAGRLADRGTATGALWLDAARGRHLARRWFARVRAAATC